MQNINYRISTENELAQPSLKTIILRWTRPLFKRLDFLDIHEMARLAYVLSYIFPIEKTKLEETIFFNERKVWGIKLVINMFTSKPERIEIGAISGLSEDNCLDTKSIVDLGLPIYQRTLYHPSRKELLKRSKSVIPNTIHAARRAIVTFVGHKRNIKMRLFLWITRHIPKAPERGF